MFSISHVQCTVHSTQCRHINIIESYLSGDVYTVVDDFDVMEGDVYIVVDDFDVMVSER